MLSPNTKFRKVFEHELLKQQTISKVQRNLVISTVPVLQEQRALRLLFIHLARHCHMLDEKDGGILLPHQLLASFLEKDPKNCNTEQELLLPYIDQVSRNFRYRDYFYQGEKCRMVLNSGVSTLLQEVFLQHGGERVYAYDLKEVNTRKLEEGQRRLKKSASHWVWRYALQEEIVHYLHNLPLSLFASTVSAHAQETYEKAITLSNPGKHIQTLRAIEDMPKPFYYPSNDPASLTPRIFGTAMQYLSKDLRRVLCPDWVEVDLKNCHLAIAGGLFHIASVQQFLQSGKSIWPELLEYMQCPAGEEQHMKSCLKTALYSLIFGMRKDHVEEQLEKDLADYQLQKTQTFTKHNLLIDIDTALKQAKRSIKTEKGMQSAFGWVPYRRGDDIDSFLANMIQTYELALVGSVYELAIREKKSKNTSFYIVLHQHDGFSFVPRKGEDTLKLFSKLNETLVQIAKTFGIITCLEQAS